MRTIAILAGLGLAAFAVYQRQQMIDLLTPPQIKLETRLRMDEALASLDATCAEATAQLASLHAEQAA